MNCGRYFPTPSIRPGKHPRQAAGLVCLFGELVNNKRCGIPTSDVDVSAHVYQLPSSLSSTIPVTFSCLLIAKGFPWLRFEANELSKSLNCQIHCSCFHDCSRSTRNSYCVGSNGTTVISDCAAATSAAPASTTRSHPLQANFGRTWRMTLKLSGMCSSCSETSSPNWRN